MLHHNTHQYHSHMFQQGSLLVHQFLLGNNDPLDKCWHHFLDLGWHWKHYADRSSQQHSTD